MFLNGLMLIVSGFGCLFLAPWLGLSLILLGHLVLLWCCVSPLFGRD